MGREAKCTVRVLDATGAERSSDARAHLDNEALIVSGPASSGLRTRVPRPEIRDVSEAAGIVTVRWDGGLVELAVGATSGAWAKALREPPKSVVDKLGVKAGATVSAVRVDEPDLLEAIEARAQRLVRGRYAAGSDVILLGVATAAHLDAIPRAVEALAPNGSFWVLHPRGVREVADTVVFATGKAAGLVATKVARVSDTLTGEMLVRPRAARA